MAFKRSGVRSPFAPLGRTDVWSEGRSEFERFAGVAQLVEHNLAKVGVAGSSPVSRLYGPAPVPALFDDDWAGLDACQKTGSRGGCPYRMDLGVRAVSSVG